MVFMVYVIMLLEVREAPGRPRFSRLVLPGVITGALLSGVLGISVTRGQLGQGAEAGQAMGASFTLTQFSTAFLSTYWLEFELTTVLLVGAIVAALAVIGISRRQGGHHG
jgi:NADH-quinone oxidoreductase subunit J